MKDTNTEDLLKCCEELVGPEDFKGIFRLIYRINKEIDKLQRADIQKEKLTSTQYLILQQLWNKDGLKFKELAEVCSCSKSTITGVIDTMEKNELVKREQNPKDRRSTLVKLEKKGIDLKSQIPNIDYKISNCCEGFNQIELNLLGKLLQKLFDSMKK